MERYNVSSNSVLARTMSVCRTDSDADMYLVNNIVHELDCRVYMYAYIEFLL